MAYLLGVVFFTYNLWVDICENHRVVITLWKMPIMYFLLYGSIYFLFSSVFWLKFQFSWYWWPVLLTWPAITILKFYFVKSLWSIKAKAIIIFFAWWTYSLSDTVTNLTCLGNYMYCFAAYSILFSFYVASFVIFLTMHDHWMLRGCFKMVGCADGNFG